MLGLNRIARAGDGAGVLAHLERSRLGNRRGGRRRGRFGKEFGGHAGDGEEAQQLGEESLSRVLVAHWVGQVEVVKVSRRKKAPPLPK
ncbi:MAG: hypothetical protein K0R17_1390 [Rariglobus sp.]|nr:hypothetical protein [Rariglobus sp.]